MGIQNAIRPIKPGMMCTARRMPCAVVKLNMGWSPRPERLWAQTVIAGYSRERERDFLVSRIRFLRAQMIFQIGLDTFQLIKLVFNTFFGFPDSFFDILGIGSNGTGPGIDFIESIDLFSDFDDRFLKGHKI